MKQTQSPARKTAKRRPRRRRITFVCTQHEYQAIEYAAAEKNAPMSVWIRLMLLRAAEARL